MKDKSNQRWSLAIETSTFEGSLALACNDQVVSSLSLEKGMRHGKSIAPGMEKLLSQEGLSPSDLAFLSVATGPGSFTGLRVGIATAKGLFLARGTEIIGVSSFAALALALFEKEKLDSPLAVLADARRGRIYGGVFYSSQEELIEEGDYWVVKRDKALSALPSQCAVAGKGTELLDFPSQVRIIGSGEDWIPRAPEIARLGWEKYQKGLRDNLAIAPMYLMVTAAEEKLDSSRD